MNVLIPGLTGCCFKRQACTGHEVDVDDCMTATATTTALDAERVCRSVFQPSESFVMCVSDERQKAMQPRAGVRLKSMAARSAS